MGTDSSPKRGAQRGRWLAVAAMAAVTAVTFSLGQWQMRRAAEKTLLQAQFDRATRSAPILVGARRLEPAALAGAAVVLRGRFVPEGTLYIDNRTHNGVAGFHVLTPVRIEASRLHVLVLRGWIARNIQDRNRLPVVPTPDQIVEITGTVEPGLPRTLELKAAPAPKPGERLWQNLDPAVYQAWSGLALQPFVVRQSNVLPIADGLVREWRTAGSDVDKHHGYALQWFVMAAAAAAVTIYLAYLIRRDSRKVRDQIA